jgi:hypothetical protein
MSLAGNTGDYADTLDVYPAGTTDFSINNVNPAFQFSIGDNHRAESIVTAGSTGAYPMVFSDSYSCGRAGGPFNFTATIKHSVVLSLGSVKKLAGRAGPVKVGVRTPDEQPITDSALQIRLIGSWTGHKAVKLANGSPSNGSVTLNVKLPKSAYGKNVSVRAQASGGDYLNAQSGVRTVQVRNR